MRLGGSRGSAAIELSTGVALLVVPLALVVLSVPNWTWRQDVARLAARDAARVVSLRGVCDSELAARIAGDLAVGAGVPRTALRVTLDCTPSASLSRGGAVTARATVDMPATVVPLVGRVTAWSWTAVHRAPVDPYGSRP